MDYRLEDDAELRSEPIYAISCAGTPPLPIARHLGIYRQTNALHDKDNKTPGDDGTLENEEIFPSVTALASPGDEQIEKDREKMSKKRKHSTKG